MSELGDYKTLVSRLQDEVLEQARLLEQARRLVDVLMTEPRFCESCQQAIG